MNKLFLWLSFGFVSLFSFSQGDSTENVHFTRYDFISQIFSEIPDSLIPTGFLLDRNINAEIEWKKYEYNDKSVQATYALQDWFDIYQTLSNARTDKENLFYLDSLLFPFFTNLFQQEPRKNGLTVPIIVLDYLVNSFTDEAIDNENFTFDGYKYYPGVNAEEGVELKRYFYAGIYLDTLRFSRLKIKYDPNFIKTNNGLDIESISIVIENDTFNLHENDELDVTPYLLYDNKDFYFKTIVNYEIPEEDFLSNFQLSSNKSPFHFDFLIGLGSLFYSDINLFDLYESYGYELADIIAGGINIPDYESELLFEENFFDEVGSFGDNPELRYGVLFGCGNYDFRKPAIFVAGFGASVPDQFLSPLQPIIHNNCTEYYDHFNLDNIMQELHNTGHDIVIVRFIEPLESLVDQADRLTELINMINQRKFANDSYIENIITGYSAGAMSVRLALDKMEYEHINDNQPHHHCKLYISFEGENAGANVCLGSQHSLTFLIQNYPDILNIFLAYIQNSASSTELTKYYYTETGVYLDVSTDEFIDSLDFKQQGHHPHRTYFMNLMENTYGTDKQLEKFGYKGYPAFSRNVCISNGSRISREEVPFLFSGQNFMATRNSPFLFSVPNGHIIMEKKLSYFFNHEGTLAQNIMKVQVRFLNNMSIIGDFLDGTPGSVFHYTENFSSNSFEIKFQTDGYVLLLDDAPGGFIDGVDPVKLVFKDFDKKMKLGPSSSNLDYRPNTFTPIVYTFDIRNFDPASQPQYFNQMHYNLQDKGLMFYKIGELGLPEESNFYGYPNLGHPTNHFAITPFEALFADEYNASHISSLNIRGEHFDVIVDSLYGDGIPHTKNFMLLEIEPYHIYLQNQKVGWNTTNSFVYKAKYEGLQTISIGENVTHKTDKDIYEIYHNGDIECVAKQSVHITEGFHAAQNSTFHAWVNISMGPFPSACSIIESPNGHRTGAPTREPIEWEEPLRIEEPTKDFHFQIFPNPSTREFTLVFENQENIVYLIKIYDLSGKIVYMDSIRETQNFNLLVEKGVYIVSMESDLKQFHQKLVIQ